MARGRARCSCSRPRDPAVGRPRRARPARLLRSRRRAGGDQLAACSECAAASRRGSHRTVHYGVEHVLRAERERPARGRADGGRRWARCRAEGKRHLPGRGGRVGEQTPDVDFRMVGDLAPCPGRGPGHEGWSPGPVSRRSVRGSRDKFGGAGAGGTCFVLPTRREAFGVVIIEAMATGLPVVEHRIDGPSRSSARGHGLLVPSGGSRRARGRDRASWLSVPTVAGGHGGGRAGSGGDGVHARGTGRGRARGTTSTAWVAGR